MDLNGDGILDLASGGFAQPLNGFIAVFLGNGDGTFESSGQLPSTCCPYGVTSGDANGDGITDLMSAEYGVGAVSVFIGNGDGTFQPEGKTLLNHGNGSENFSLSVGDFNQDGRLDLATETGGYAAVLLNTSASVSPVRLDFHTEFVGESSPTQPVTLTNIGTSDLHISSISVSGEDPTAFVIRSKCGTVLAPGFRCFIAVRFKPHVALLLTANLVITDDAVGRPQTVQLTGIGNQLELTPAQGVDFGTVPVGQTSQAMTLTVTNPYQFAAAFLYAHLFGENAGDFLYRSKCPYLIQPFSSCTIKVQFTPGAAGLRGARLGIATSQQMGDLVYQSVPLKGTGQ